jgi:hypothetical protein
MDAKYSNIVVPQCAGVGARSRRVCGHGRKVEAVLRAVDGEHRHLQ